MTAMKRKLNSEDVPEVVAPEGGETPAAAPAKATFDTLNLDAITREKFTEPTPVQAATLPLALNGKDILGMFGRFERQ
jgi:ATP-dependent RNA helicase DDX56/DBP9